MQHQDYLLNEHNHKLRDTVLNWFVMLIIAAALVSLPISIFTNFHTWKMLRNLEDIRLDQFKMQQDIQNIEQRRCK